MRGADEILRLVVAIAAEDPRIRAVLLGGSRADPSRPVDILQDYDLVFVVTDVAPFVGTRGWAQQFGDILLLQEPEAMDDPPPARDGTWAYLMLFNDGTRIDLTLCPLDAWRSVPGDHTGVVLLDKDGHATMAFAAGAARRATVTAKAFDDCCNEFLWVSTNVAKGLWRGEGVYAKVMLERFVRPQAMRMLDWYIASERNEEPGPFGRRYSELLPAEWWGDLSRTYTDMDPDRSWAALFGLHDVFRAAGLAVSRRAGLTYPSAESDNVRAYLVRVRSLPRDATTIF